MKGLADYRKLFEQAKSKEDVTQRRNVIENLLNQYTNDQKILNQAEFYSRSGKTEKIHEMVELELAMKKGLREPVHEGLSKIGKVKERLKRVNEDLESSKFMGFSYRAAEVSNRLTPKDLNKQFTI
jgi:hypothetical protein